MDQVFTAIISLSVLLNYLRQQIQDQLSSRHVSRQIRLLYILNLCQILV